MLPNNLLKLRGSETLSYALSLRYFLNKKSILDKVRLPRMWDYKTLILQC